MSSPVRSNKASAAKHAPAIFAASPNPTRPDALLYCVILFDWIAVWRIQDLFPVLGAVKLPILIQLITLGLFIADQSPQRRLNRINTPIVKLILGLLGIMLIGLPVSLWPGKGFDFISRDFFPTVALMIILATSIRNTKDLQWAAFAHLAGGAFHAFMVYTTFDVGSDGRLGGMVYYDANDLALLLVCTMPIAIFFLRPSVIWWRRIFALGSLSLFVLMMMKSGSRGGFLGFAGIMLLILLTYKAVPVKFRLGAVIGGALILLLVGSSSYWDLISTIFHPEDDYNMTEDVGRSAVWKRGMGYMWSHPVLGVGVRAFPQAEGMISDIAKQYAARGQGIKWSVAHNSFVSIGAELGVTGLLMFLGILGLTMSMLWKVGRPAGRATDTREDAAFSQAFIISLAGYCISGFFISAEYLAILYVLLAFCLAQNAVLNDRAHAETRIAPKAVFSPKNIQLQSAPSSPKVVPTYWTPRGKNL